jgi:hypothetical protein
MSSQPLIEKKYKVSPTVVSRIIDKDTLLVPLSKSASQINAIYNINGVGTRIYQQLDGVKTLQHVAESIVQEFEVTPEEAARDTLEFVGQLLEVGVIHEV